MRKLLFLIAIVASGAGCPKAGDEADTTAPETVIDEAPAPAIPLNLATFVFSGTDDGGVDHFRCSLDGATPASCDSPHTVIDLAEGGHSFSVAAVDTAGNVDPSPATHDFAVDRVAPDTILESGPTGTISEVSPTFTFSSPDADAVSFECQVDTDPFEACASPHTTAVLSAFPHTFFVRAVDRAGNVDPEPASATFNVRPPFPSVAATWSVALDLALPALTGALAPLQRLLDRFFGDPSGVLLQILAAADAGEGYFKATPWDSFFLECAAPGDPVPACAAGGELTLTPLGEMLRDHLDVVAEEGLAALGVGGSLSMALSAGAEIFESAEGHGLDGQLVLPDEPLVTGELGDQGSLVMNALIWRWGNGERLLNLRSEFFLRADNLSAAVVIDPSDGTTPALHLDPFDLGYDLPWITLLVLESVVLPETLDPAITSFEELFGTLLGCDAIYDRVRCEGAHAGDPACDALLAAQAGLLRSSCEIMSTASVAALEDWLTVEGLGAGGGFLRLETPVDAACPFTVDGGTDEATELGAIGGPCLLDAELHQAGEQQSLTARYTGSRL